MTVAGRQLQAGVATTLLLGLTAAVLRSGGAPLAVDRVVADLVDGGSGAARVITQLGSGAVLYPVLLVVVGLRLRRGASPRDAVLPIVVLASAQAIEAVAFVTLTRPGPGTGTVSFSSGHTMAAALGWGLVARTQLRRGAQATAAIAALVVGSTRVMLDLHWLTDVVAGALLGGAVLAVVAPHLGHESNDGERPASAARESPLTAAARAPWMWALTAVGLAVAVVPLVAAPEADRMKDLLVYIGAGETAGAGRDVYDFRTAFDMPFTYPPFAALLSEPLSRVPLGLLHVLWVVATVAALVAVARVAMGPVVARLGLPLTLALLLVSSPVRSHLRFGQVGVFLVLIVAADLLRDHDRHGVGLGAAIALKLTPAVYLPWLVVTRRTRVLVTAVAVAGGLTAAALVLLWPSAHEYLWRAVWDSDRFGANDIPGNQSVRGMLLRSPLSDGAANATWLLAAAALGYVGTRNAARLERAGNRLGAVGVLAALSVAVSPIAWVHHLVFLVLPLSALVAAARPRLAAAWSALLIVSLPALGAAGLRSGAAPEAFWHLVLNGQGATAVAAVLLLPRLADRPEATGRPMSRRAIVVALAAVLGTAATGAVLATTRVGAGVTVDSGEYLAVADGLASGHGYSMPYLSYSEPYPDAVRIGARTRMTQYPPGFPTVIAVGQRLTGAEPEVVGRWVNAVALGLTTALATLVVHAATGSVVWSGLAGAMLVRPPMVLAHSRLLSEPLALVALVAAVALTARCLRDPTRRNLTLLAVAGASGTAVRHPGIVAVVCAAFALLVWGRGSRRRRLRDAAFVGVGGALPLVAWFARNAVVGRASDKGLAWHWPTTRAWGTALDRWLGWVGPHDGPAQVLSAVALLALIGWAARGARRRRRDGDIAPLPVLCSLFAAAYIAFVVVVRAVLDANLSFGSRMFLPVLLLATVGVTSAAARLTQRGQVAVLLVVGAILVRSTASLAGTNVPSFPGSASSGYRAERWTSSPALRYVAALDPSVVVATNAPDAMWLHTRRASLFLPLRTDLYRARANVEFTRQVRALRRATAGRSVLVVFFHHPTRKGRVRVIDRAVVEALGLRLLVSVADSSIYAPAGPPARA